MFIIFFLLGSFSGRLKMRDMKMRHNTAGLEIATQAAMESQTNVWKNVTCLAFSASPLFRQSFDQPDSFLA